MKKNIIGIALMSLWLGACSESHLPGLGYGWLSADIGRRQAEVERVETRSVSEGLAVDVKGITDTDISYHFEGDQVDEELNSLQLPVGDYTLTAYSPNSETSYGDTELGDAKWRGSKTFTILEGTINRVGLTVPMTNLGVTLELPAGFETWFSDFQFTATLGTRSMAIGPLETAYFDPVEGEDLHLQLTLENTDGEQFSTAKTIPADEVRTGSVYHVIYDIRTRALRCLE